MSMTTEIFLLRCGKDGNEPAKVDPPAKKNVAIPPKPATPKDSTPDAPAFHGFPAAEEAPTNKAPEPAPGDASEPAPGLLGPKNYSCEPCKKYYDNSHIWHYHNHMDKKHGIPNPMANQVGTLF